MSCSNPQQGKSALARSRSIDHQLDEERERRQKEAQLLVLGKLYLLPYPVSLLSYITSSHFSPGTINFTSLSTFALIFLSKKKHCNEICIRDPNLDIHDILPILSCFYLRIL